MFHIRRNMLLVCTIIGKSYIIRIRKVLFISFKQIFLQFKIHVCTQAYLGGSAVLQGRRKLLD